MVRAFKAIQRGEVGRQETGFARLPLSGQLGPGQRDSTSFLCEREWTEVVFGCVCVCLCVCERESFARLLFCFSNPGEALA